VCWAALAVAVGGLVLAKVNSHNVSAIEIDFSQQLEAAKARAEEMDADEAPTAESEMSDAAEQAKREEVKAKEDDAQKEGKAPGPIEQQGADAPPDDPSDNASDDAAQPAGSAPKYSYRQEGKVQREAGKQLEEKIPIDSTADGEEVASGGRLMSMQQVAEANRWDRLNLRFARWTFYLALGLCVIDYFRRFNTTFGCYLPLPFSAPLVDSLFPKSHTVCVGKRPRNWKRYLARAVRKGETFVYFSNKDPWRQQRLRRLPWYIPLPWRLDKVCCTNGDRHFEDEFLFESAWFGRYCFILAGDGPPAVDLLESLAAFLDLRHATRARARRTVNVVWDLDTAVPEATLDRLLPLCRETNFRLIVTRIAPSDAGQANRFDETYG
jgi:hypothetical protein